jgi:hypothetical protein
MRRNSSSSSGSSLAIAACCLLAAGCSETVQRKFIRRAKAQPRPSPITRFEDYTAGLTPVDRYRKQYMLFEYWSEELLSALLPTSSNAKRLRRASAESRQQLERLVAMLEEPLASQVRPLLEERRGLDRRLQDPVDDFASVSLLRQKVELQQRRIHRLMAVSKVEEQLKSAASD